MTEGQGPHMARDDVLLFSGDGKAPLGIDAGRAGMGKAVHLEQAAQAPERAALVPVVEIEVMEEGPHGQRRLICAQMEAAVEPEAHQHHILAVLVGGHIAVLDKFPHPLHFGVLVILGQNGGEALTLRIRKLH